ncbi:MAG: SGNH/GDSL hydrolase family protein [Prosthecobacter sp.]|nr:SGNH/GDSL hydrolase family protein [Prosthecobacter sp.]
MKRRLLLTFFSLSLLLPISAQETKPTAKKSQPHPSVVPVKDVEGLPRVLLIGDSISMGYTLPTRKLLEGVANVHRIPQNGGPTKNGVANMDKWLGDGHWDVIHFNWGIHDLKFMPDGKRQVEAADYEANLRSLVARMQKTGAKLIFATTTPIPKGPLIPPREFGQVADYNAIALKVMKDMGVTVNDLNAWITPKLAEMQKPQDVHYLDSGYDYLAEKVAQEIRTALGK